MISKVNNQNSDQTNKFIQKQSQRSLQPLMKIIIKVDLLLCFSVGMIALF